MDQRKPPDRIDDWHLTDDLHVPKGKGDPFAAAIRATRMAMLITDPKQPDNPIVFANNAFLQLTGYERHEVIGRNCRFLQGPETDQAAIATLREAIAERRDAALDILNYKRDGSIFWNALYISPVTDEKGELHYFFASQLDITERKQAELRVRAEKARFEQAVKERTRELENALEAKTMLLHEVDHRVKNNLQMVSSLIMLQSRTIEDERIRKSLRSMQERIEALSTVHRRLYQSDDVSRFDVSEFVGELATDLVKATGRDDITVETDVEPIEIPAQKAAPVALLVNELITNALKHAFPSERPGTISVRIARLDGHFEIDVSDDGVGMPEKTSNDAFGTRIVQSLAKQLRATLTWKPRAPGTQVVVRLPADVIKSE